MEKSSRNKLRRWLGSPMRALSRACDSYVRTMSSCAGRMPMEAAAVSRNFGPTTLHAASFSSASRRKSGLDGGGNDVDELILAASQQRAGGSSAAVPVRSRSVAVGRIDEDAPCEFSADARVGPALPVRRSRSVEVGGLAGRPGGRGFGFGATKKAGRVMAN